MDFVVACSNIRSFIYNIPQKTRFDVKSMAGNIIPAIATTNAVIAGGIVMEALKIINVSITKKKFKVQKSPKSKKIQCPEKSNAHLPKKQRFFPRFLP